MRCLLACLLTMLTLSKIYSDIYTYRDQLYHNIQNGPLKLPSYLSEEARSILVQLLNRNPYKRLGAGKKGAAEIKEHPFFKGLDWKEAESR